MGAILKILVGKNSTCTVHVYMYSLRLVFCGHNQWFDKTIYRRVRIKRPWAGNLRMQRKRGVGAKCVVRRIWHVVSAHHPEKAGIFDKSLFLL